MWSGTAANRRQSGAGASGVVIVRYQVSNLQATGGSVQTKTIQGTEYNIHTFLADGSFEITSGEGDVEYLVVGGGGGGGNTNGGAGGSVIEGSTTLSVGVYPVAVGAGGATTGLNASFIQGNPGTGSSVFGIAADGGDGGISGDQRIGGPGAGGETTIAEGGPGAPSSITGEVFFYAAGGGGGVFSTDPDNFGGVSGTSYRPPNQDNTGLDFSFESIASINNTGSWFRIREPETVGPRREFVFQRGDTGQKLFVKYSRSTGFISGGSPTSSPTTGSEGDGVVVSSTTQVDEITSPSSALIFNSVGSSNRINVVASNSPAFGVFPFYIWAYRNGTGSCDSIILHEGVLPGTTSSLDQDPTYRVVASGATQLGFLNQGSAAIGDYWEAYGLPNAVHRRGNLGFASVYGTNIGASGTSSVQTTANASRIFPPVNVIGLSPYSESVITASALVGIGGRFPKGFSTGVSFSGFTNQNVLDTFNLSSANPKIVAHYPNAREAIYLPWVPNVIPQV
jgi:hypothetical protein